MNSLCSSRKPSAYKKNIYNVGDSCLEAKSKWYRLSWLYIMRQKNVNISYINLWRWETKWIRWQFVLTNKSMKWNRKCYLIPKQTLKTCWVLGFPICIFGFEFKLQNYHLVFKTCGEAVKTTNTLNIEKWKQSDILILINTENKKWKPKP